MSDPSSVEPSAKKTKRDHSGEEDMSGTAFPIAAQRILASVDYVISELEKKPNADQDKKEKEAEIIITIKKLRTHLAPFLANKSLNTILFREKARKGKGEPLWCPFTISWTALRARISRQSARWSFAWSPRCSSAMWARSWARS
jgi:hypothetical protein